MPAPAPTLAPGRSGNIGDLGPLARCRATGIRLRAAWAGAPARVRWRPAVLSHTLEPGPQLSWSGGGSWWPYLGVKAETFQRAPQACPRLPRLSALGAAGLVSLCSCDSGTATEEPSPCWPGPAPLRQGCAPGQHVPGGGVKPEPPDPQGKREGMRHHPCTPAQPLHPTGWGPWLTPWLGLCVPWPGSHMQIHGPRRRGRMPLVPSLGLRWLFCRAGVRIPTLEGCCRISVSWLLVWGTCP